LATKLRDAGRSEATIKSHLAHLKAALNWGVRMGMLARAPSIDMPKRVKGASMMKGRPITLEEFERMLRTVRKVVGRAAARSWRRYLRGLWLSGLRISESLTLTWDGDRGLRIDLQPGERPMLRIPAEAEKGHKDRLLPLAPEFAEYILRTPEAQRTGFVFNLTPRRVKWPRRPSVVTVMRVTGLIGERAGIKVKVDSDNVKFASAHDLRRSFGQRWASRVMPQVLMELMRHESIETTMAYYVGRNAQTTAEVLWAVHSGKQNGNTRQNRASAAQGENAQEPCQQEV
jgi:integrase